MAAQFTSEMTRGGDIFTALPEDIRLAPELNGRHEHTDVEALASDIERNGQHTPCIIRKDDEGYPVLVAGHRRYRAIALLNSRNEMQRKVLCTYRKGLTEVGSLIMAVSENRFRKDVSPIDDAANIGLLMGKFGLSEKDVAAIYFPESPTAPESLRFVKQRAALIELAPEAAQAVREGRVKVTAAVALAKLTKSQQREKVKGEGKVKTTAVTDKPAAPKSDAAEALLKRGDRMAALILAEGATDWEEVEKAAKSWQKERAK